jgi:hypothetical protein
MLGGDGTGVEGGFGGGCGAGATGAGGGLLGLDDGGGWSAGGAGEPRGEGVAPPPWR